MYVVKLLKRKDASSVVIAVWLAFQLMQLTSVVSMKAVSWLTGLGDSTFQNAYSSVASDWRNAYLNPVVSLLVQLVVLEVVVRLVVWVHPMLVKKSK